MYGSNSVRGASDAVHLYLNEIQCSLVAKTGIPSDRYHLGKLTLEAFRDTPETVLQMNSKTPIETANQK
ncbi:unnamed protein product [Leptidea sinapis]|uniref:Uncharacterized protein n=1 Tax=Leptidea sinapis TaxID=189913 RepID=A0A5E4QG73_9NEOP|nr:unnamed protein product [Leptidea sinapis]